MHFCEHPEFPRSEGHGQKSVAWVPSLAGMGRGLKLAEVEEEVARNPLRTCIGASSAQTFLSWGTPGDLMLVGLLLF